MIRIKFSSVQLGLCVRALRRPVLRQSPGTVTCHNDDGRGCMIPLQRYRLFNERN